eukprot:Nitzschia sp. Nitz4//scaffold134_size62860//47609//48040//NITZ4_006334-RA/size62860-processed-gene-0.84-mRNA-1//1//CDS//3329535514//1513//frame0
MCTKPRSGVLVVSVAVFAKSWCPYCDKTKDLLKKPEFANVTIRIFDLDEMPKHTPSGPAIQAALRDMTGQTSVPNVWINGEFLGGNDTTHGAYHSGKLQKMLSIA